MTENPTIKDLENRINKLESERNTLLHQVNILQKSEENYRILIENQSDLVIKVDPNGSFLFVSPSYCQKFGVSEEELLGKTFMPMVHEDDRVKTEKRMNELKHPPYMTYVEQRSLTKDGWRWLAWMYTAIIDDTNTLVATIGVGRDITERKSAELARERSETFLEDIIESIQDGISVLEADLTIRHVNSVMRNWYRENIPLEGKKCFQCYHNRETPCDPCPTIRALKSGKTEFNIVSGLPGSPVEWIELFSFPIKDRITGAITGVVEYVRDITEKRKLEQQLIHAQKMEAIGELAGGIAHDFNNLLMGIQGRTSLILNEITTDDVMYENLKGIEEFVISASDLTKQLLGFARGGKYEVRPYDINEIVIQSAQMFGRTRKEIDIVQRFQDDIWVVEVDRSQIEQVLLNLFVNAGQAMPEGGSLYLETVNEVVDNPLSHSLRLQAGRYVKIAVTDTGIGMDDKTRARIFDPFFTTKDMGRGTGLGLASAYGIIKNHQGLITVYSQKGEGATFNIYLPASDKELLQSTENPERSFSGTGTILLVDDEQIILDVCEPMLNLLGYNVITARGGLEAIDILREKDHTIDLIILDMIMPGISGSETFDRLRGINPDSKILLSSGYSLNGQATEILNRGCNGFIQKPFNINHLASKIQEIFGTSTE